MVEGSFIQRYSGSGSWVIEYMIFFLLILQLEIFPGIKTKKTNKPLLHVIVWKSLHFVWKYPLPGVNPPAIN